MNDLEELYNEFMYFFRQNNYNHYIENNPYEEFFAFCDQTDYKKDLLLSDLMKEIENAINHRTSPDENDSQVTLEKLQFRSNLSGVNYLKKLAVLISQNHYYNNYENDMYNYYEYYFEIKVKFLYVNLIINFIFASKIKELKITTLESFINVINTTADRNGSKRKNNYSILFRGQTNSKWNIIPSILRNIDQSKTFIIDYDFIIDIYRKINVYEKYDKIIGHTDKVYDMVSFFQHSISLSPLVDFTERIEVASFFALSDQIRHNEFYNNDASIYVLQNSPGENFELHDDEVLKNIRIGVYKKGKRTLDDYLLMYNKMGNLFNTNADVFIHKVKTNDRMRYQSGAFVLYDNYIIDSLENTLLTTHNSSAKILKIIIDRKVKKEILEYLIKHYPEYQLRYLMNPYMIFEDC